MDLGSISLILALALAVTLFITRPLFERRGRVISRQEHDYSHLLAERERILTTLQELDFDFALGKVPESGYPEQRTELLKRGAETLRQLDELKGESADKTVEARLEAAVEARRASLGVTAVGSRVNPTVTLPDDQIESLLAQRRRSRDAHMGAGSPATRAAGFCANCGAPLQQSDHFCSKCGTKV